MSINLPQVPTERLIFAIGVYLEIVRRAVHELLDDYSSDEDSTEEDPVYDILGGWRDGRVPTSGMLPSGRRFEFHGNGCRFEHGSRSIEMVFSPEGYIDCFDAEKLFLFMCEYPELGSYTRDEIRATLEKLETDGIAKRRPNCEMYVLKYDH